jgi:hypothetical protein
VRVLLDEQLPRRSARELVGHQVRTVQQEGWAGVQNGELLRRAADRGFEVFLTADQNLEFQQNLAQAGLRIIVLVAPSNALEDLQPLVPAALTTIARVRPGEVVRVSRARHAPASSKRLAAQPRAALPMLPPSPGPCPPLVGCSGWLGAWPRHERVLLGVRDRVDVKVHIELRPVEVVRLRTFDVENRTHRCVSKPGEVLEREEVLRFVEQQPEAVRRDAEDFNA